MIDQAMPLPYHREWHKLKSSFRLTGTLFECATILEVRIQFHYWRSCDYLTVHLLPPDLLFPLSRFQDNQVAFEISPLATLFLATVQRVGFCWIFLALFKVNRIKLFECCFLPTREPDGASLSLFVSMKQL